MLPSGDEVIQSGTSMRPSYRPAPKEIPRLMMKSHNRVVAIAPGIGRLYSCRLFLDVSPQPSLLLASFSIEIRAARASSGVLSGLANARRTGRGPSLVFADISNPYRSMPVMLAEVISVAFEKALQ